MRWEVDIVRKRIFVALLATVCMLLCACNEADNKNPLAEMQMIYEENPAHWSKDLKLI
jgi:hypothetical protein